MLQYVCISAPWNDEKSGEQLRRLLTQEGFAPQFLPMEWLEESGHAQSLSDLAERTGCVLMIYDGYAMSRDALEELMQLGKPVLLAVKEESLLEELAGVSVPYVLWPELMLDTETRRAFLQQIARYAQRREPLCAEHVSFRLDMSNTWGAVTQHSAEARTIMDDVWYRISVEEWQVLTLLIRQITAYMLGLEEDEVTVTPDDFITPANCAPEDGKVYYYEGYRIFFNVTTARPPQRELFNSFTLSTLLGCVAVELLRDGQYIFRSLPMNPTLADAGLDEAILRDMTLQLMQFMYPLQQVSAAPAFGVEVYSDGSGSFRLPCTIT